MVPALPSLCPVHVHANAARTIQVTAFAGVRCAAKPTAPVEPALAVTGPLQLTASWKPPANWNTQPGNYEIIVIQDASPLWVHLVVRK